MRASGATVPYVKFVGLPLPSVMFAIRIWAATMLALLAAFWLQIEGAASAATCVAILALQTRGQVWQKAIYRLLGTAVGGVAAVALTGLFSQERDLFLVAFAGWVAMCVFVAGLLDGNRAYGAQLSGYTVALSAVQLIDAPQQVFLSTVNRCAAITVGIVALAVVNDLLAAPNVRTSLIRRLEAARQQVQKAARRRPDSDEVMSDAEAGRLLGTIAALHPDVTALSAEAIGGRVRAAAARSAVFGLVQMVFAARRPASTDVMRLDAALDPLEAFDRVVLSEIACVETGCGDSRRIPFPIFRSRAIAAHNAWRTFAVLLSAGLLFCASGWSSSSLALSLVAVTMALSATAPNARGFAIGACIAMPLAIAAAGITEFLVLDGVTDFPLLALAMAPTVTGACLLVATNRPPLAPVGILLLVFFPIFLSPANPQNYSPQAFLTTATMAIASVAVLFVGLTTVLPVDDGDKRRWFLKAARSDLLAPLRERRRFAPKDLMRDADRIAQAAALRSGAIGPDDLATLFWCTEMAASTAEAQSIAAANGAPRRAELLRSIRTLDATILRSVAEALDSQTSAGALTRIARLIESRPAGAERLLAKDME